MKKVLLKHETDSLGCIFELLKRNPMLVHVGTGGDGVEPAERPMGRISIEDYLEMLESKLPSGDNGETPDGVEESLSEDNEPSLRSEDESVDDSKTPSGEEEESLSEDNQIFSEKVPAFISDQSSGDDTEGPLDSENEIEIVMNLSSEDSTDESDLDPLDNEVDVRRSQVAPDLAEQTALLDAMLDDYM